MDSYDPRADKSDINLAKKTASDKSRSIKTAHLPPASHFPKELVKFAIYFSAFLLPVVSGLDFLAQEIQSLTAGKIVISPENPDQSTIDKNLARYLVIFSFSAAFAIFWFGRNFVRARQTLHKMAHLVQSMEEGVPNNIGEASNNDTEKDQRIRSLQQRIEKDMRVLRTIHKQIYRDSAPRLNYASVKGLYHVNAEGDLKVHKEITLKANDKEGHFWTFYANGTEFSKRLESVDELDFSVSALDPDTDLLHITTVDEELRKEFAVYFLPSLQPGETRSFTLSYVWPRSFRKLLETGSDTYDWHNRAPTTGMVGDFSAEWTFDEALGIIECQNTGSKPPGLKLFQTLDERMSHWVLEGEQVAMGNIPYELTFLKQDRQ